MAAFVVSLILLIHKRKDVIFGIKINGIEMFADHEIDRISGYVQKIEFVLGLKMHRDPKRNKCQAHSFGQDRAFTDWAK